MTVSPSSIGNNSTSSPTPVLVTQRVDRVWIAKLLSWADFSFERVPSLQMDDWS